MTSPTAVWTARLLLRCRTKQFTEALERTLTPEAEREVPRAHTAVSRLGDDTVELAITARDVGAMRAALNTYLGWVALSTETGRAAASSRGSGTRAR